MKKYTFATLVAILALSACKEKDKEKQQPEPQKIEQQSTDTLSTITQAVPVPVKPAQEDKYFLIAGSFLNQAYANDYENQLKQRGFDAKVVQRSWGANSEYFRVACKSFYDKTEAYNALSQMQQSQEIQNVWLLVK